MDTNNNNKGGLVVTYIIFVFLVATFSQMARGIVAQILQIAHVPLPELLGGIAAGIFIGGVSVYFFRPRNPFLGIGLAAAICVFYRCGGLNGIRLGIPANLQSPYFLNMLAAYALGALLGFLILQDKFANTPDPMAYFKPKPETDPEEPDEEVASEESEEVRS